MKAIKAVVTENVGSWNRFNFKLLAFLENPDDQEIDTRMKTNAFLIKSSPAIMKFLIESVMEEIKPLVVEKEEFEYREVSKLLELSGTFGLSGLWRKEQKHQLLLGVLWHICKEQLSFMFSEKREVQREENS